MVYASLRRRYMTWTTRSSDGIIFDIGKLSNKVKETSWRRKLTVYQLQFIGSMRYICHFKVPDFVPETGVIDYLSLAQHCGVDPGQLKQNL